MGLLREGERGIPGLRVRAVACSVAGGETVGEYALKMPACPPFFLSRTYVQWTEVCIQCTRRGPCCRQLLSFTSRMAGLYDYLRAGM